MNIKLIEIYINNITKNQANDFLEENDIYLNEKEFDYLFSKIKSNYIEIINEDILTFKEIKDNITEQNYIKLISLFNNYKKYLN
ncbi:MAG: hypothetical protein IJH20_04015 [Bacilli bacterium]|nr:hypothetical protein [Bacilli bacterium]